MNKTSRQFFWISPEANGCLPKLCAPLPVREKKLSGDKSHGSLHSKKREPSDWPALSPVEANRTAAAITRDPESRRTGFRRDAPAADRSARVAVTTTPGAAWALADEGKDGAIVSADKIAEALAPLSPAATADQPGDHAGPASPGPDDD